jgi:hypothetical protein
MKCLDCLAEPAGQWLIGDAPQPAVAMCGRCGAGLCERHAVVGTEALTVTVTINHKVAVEPPARSIRCRQCDAAERAQRRAEGWAPSESQSRAAASRAASVEPRDLIAFTTSARRS